jgi:hypothetical protein
MFENKGSVLLILSQDVLDQARVLAGRATAALKLPVSLQIVLRALIGEGLKREDHPALLANIEGQAKAVRQQRSFARRAGRLVVTLSAAAVGVMTAGCAQGPSASVAVVEAKTSTVTPASVAVKAGIVTDAVADWESRGAQRLSPSE